MRSILIICTTFLLVTANAQTLTFTNLKTNKSYLVKPGTKVFLGFKGYNQQQEFATNFVFDITDSTIVLGFSPNVLGRLKKPNASVNNIKTIRISDLTHFRKRSAVAEISKDVINIAATLGSVIFLSDVYRSENISTTNAFLMSLGSGLLINWGVRIAFPNNAKYTLNEGWKVTFSSE
ncbi:MAG: hypothetical protein H3C45_11495 [Bacteroidia bacterium]|nr:hypothetical protein [Bacteroidia bacterium]